MEPKRYYTNFLVKKINVLKYKKTIFLALEANKKYSLFIFVKKIILKNKSPPFIRLVKIKLIGGI